MCQRCNYSEMLEVSGLEATPNRMRVLEVIGNNSSPVSAQDIFVTLRRITNINRVTVYRILDVLVDRRLVDRLSSGGRNQVYGMAPNEQHPAHPHFRCDSCGSLQCLQPGSLKVDLKGMERSFTGEIKNVEVRVNGTCRNCLKKAL
jgi:Fur family transcriptional regulator, ferric uptake regulator